MIENLQVRLDIMSSFAAIFSRESYMNGEPGQLCKHVDTLCEQFAIPKAKAIDEVKDFMFYVKAAGDDQFKTQDDFLQNLTASPESSISIYSTSFPSLAKLARIYRVLPPHTADCERDFSKLNLIKPDIRNRMGESTLDFLLRIRTEGPPIGEYPFENAVKLWAQKKDRRYKIRLI